MQPHIVAFENPVERFGNLLGELDACNLITPTAPGDPDQAWRQQLTELCPTGRAIYVLHHNQFPKYVGRTNRLVGRIIDHIRMTNDEQPHPTATLAPIVARDLFRAAEGREDQLFGAELVQDFGELAQPRREEFLAQAIQRLRQMQVKAVEVPHPHDQTVFEVYVHEMWGTEYNSFETH